MDSPTFAALLAGCLVALVSAGLVVLAQKPIYAAVALLVHSLSIAALFAILAAGLVAVGQVIIYSGAIVVLFLFVVTLLPLSGQMLPPSGAQAVSAMVGAAALIVAFGAMLTGPLPAMGTTLPGGVPAVGQALFGPLLTAMELTAPLLLAALVGAVTIWRRHEPQLPPAPRSPGPTGPRRVVLHK